MDTELDVELSDDEEVVTSEVVLQTLQTAWINEKSAPEILPHKHEMVECMLGQIQHMETNVNKLPKTDFRVGIHKMELSRIKYLISSYLRTRLEKIEKFTIKILNDERLRIDDGTNYLTPAEYQYAQAFLNNTKSHFTSVALDNMPGNMQTFDANKMANHPDMDAHVFLKVNETVNGVILEGINAEQDEEIDLEAGSQHILQYKSVGHLVKSGKVELL